MKVILKNDINTLGFSGDEVTVANGYARNFLLPRGHAVASTKANLMMIESLKKKRQLRRTKLKEDAESLAQRLKEITCTITKKVGEKNKLFGSVTSQEIAKSLKALGLDIDKKLILLDSTIKDLGEFNIPVKLHPEITQNIKIVVAKHEQ